ncbi:unnamed protein product [Polarella glacialis]|nr:unnamed protein product [Polarella glacialis]
MRDGRELATVLATATTQSQAAKQSQNELQVKRSGSSSILRSGSFSTILRRGSSTMLREMESFTWTDAAVEHAGSYSYTVTACHLPAAGKLREAVLKERQARVAPEEHDFLLDVQEGLNAGEASSAVEASAVDELEIGRCQEQLRRMLKSGGITVFYKTSWARAYAHCCASEELGWSTLPGLSLEPSPCHAFPASEGWLVLCLPYAKSLDLVMNDGPGNQWDKAPGGRNYTVAVPGVMVLSGGQLERVVPPPQEPRALQAEALDGSRIRLTWQPPAVAADEAPVSCYKVFRNGRLVGQTELTSCVYQDVNLFAFTDYEYSVAAVNRQQVAGPLSEPITAKTELPGPPSEPRNLRAGCRKEASQGGELAVRLEWEPPADCGGAPVAAYEILRNGTVVWSYQVPAARLRSEAQAAQPMDPEAAAERRWVRSSCSYSQLSWFKDVLEWTDTDIRMGESYSYQVRAVQLGPERADELRSSAGGLVQRCGSRFLDNVLSDVVGPVCEAAEVRAVAFLDAPKLGERKCMIMFQAFDWDSCKASCWYDVLLGLLPELRTAGVNLMWLPPPSDSVDHHGYLPRKWYVLDNHYGSAEQLQNLVTAMHEQEIIPMLDVVVNHRCASLQDSAGRWLKFEEPDWEGWAVCRDSTAVPGGTGAGVTGEPAQYAPSTSSASRCCRQVEAACEVVACLRQLDAWQEVA